MRKYPALLPLGRMMEMFTRSKLFSHSMPRSLLFLASVSVIALLGAGCPSGSRPVTSAPTVAKQQGFGKLPPLQTMAPQEEIARTFAPDVPVVDVAQNSAVLGTPEAISSAPSAMRAPSGVSGSAPAGSAIARPMPVPYPMPRPVSVTYTIDATMPSWGTEGEVLRRDVVMPDKKIFAPIAAVSGLPGQLISKVRSLRGANVQWEDTDGFTWTFDLTSRSMSFWKDVGDGLRFGSDPGKESARDDKKWLAVADAFLDAHGFSAVRRQGGAVEQGEAIQPMMGAAENAVSSGMPCILGADVAPSIYPSPCGNWSPQVTVVYGGSYEARPILDMWGNPYRSTNIVVDRVTNKVTNGSLQLDDTFSRSAYPLISVETARKRLQSGGRNPVYPWGTEEGNVRVTVKNIAIVWIRYETWNAGASQLYYLPGLLATGTVQRGNAADAGEEYRTVVSLVNDDAFDDGADVPVPVPMMRTQTQP